MTADTALRLALYFDDTTPEFWLGLQLQHDLDKVRKEIDQRIAAEVKLHDK